jgi:AraC-like DNA-binding protein
VTTDSVRDSTGLSASRAEPLIGDWTYAEVRPRHLTGVVDRIWHAAGRFCAARERAFPNGCVEILLHLEDRFKGAVALNGPFEVLPLIALSSQRVTPQVIESPEGQCCVLGIRLTAIGAYQLLGPEGVAVSSHVQDLRDLMSPSERLYEHCLRTCVASERLRIATRWIEERLSYSRPIHPGIAAVVEQLRESRGRVSIVDLQTASGIGRSRFFALFREHVGLSAKQFARVIRFQHSLALVQRGIPVVRVAALAGFSDQSHMTVEFGELGGLTPARVAERTPYAHTVNVAEEIERAATA